MSVIFIIVIVLLISDMNNVKTVPCVVLGTLKVTDNADAWERFVEQSAKGQVGKLRVKWADPDISSEAELEFDGQNYKYKEGQSQETYKYLLELRGTMPFAAGESYFIVLADVQYSFNEIAQSLYSSESKYANIPYKLLN